jgi:chromosome segregation protein
MLMANPIERRAILEEAAGVAKFKSRKVEAQRKLERSEVNLVRVREDLANTERRLRIVKGQAAKARRFKELDERYRQLRVDLALDIYHELRERLVGLTSQITELENSRREMLEVLRGLEDDKQSAEIARHELQGTHRDMQQQCMEHAAARKHAEQRRDLTERNIAEARQHIADDKLRVTELTSKIDELNTQIAQADQAIIGAQSRVTQAEQLVQTLSDDRIKLQESMTEARARHERARESANRETQAQSQLESRLQAIAGRSHSLAEQISRLNDRRAQLDEEVAQTESASSAANQALIAADSEADTIEAELNDHDRAAAALGQQQAELTSQLSEVRHQRAAMGSRHHLLEEMHDAREGLGDAVKTVLNNPDLYPGVRGLLADAIDTDRRHARLVETALGRDLELLLVDNAAELETLAPSLRELTGRVGVLTLNESVPEASSSEESTESLPQYAVPIMSMLQVQPHAQAAVTRLLGRTVVAWDLQMAQSLTAGCLRGWRIVTQHGDVIEPDGRTMLGQSFASDTNASTDGWLTRRIELTELRARIIGLDTRVESLSAVLNGLVSQSAQAQDHQRALDERLRAVRDLYPFAA